MVPSVPSPTTPTKLVVPENMDPVEESIHLGVIVRIFGKLYTMSKMMEIILLYYGAEVYFELTTLLLSHTFTPFFLEI